MIRSYTFLRSLNSFLHSHPPCTKSRRIPRSGSSAALRSFVNIATSRETAHGRYGSYAKAYQESIEDPEKYWGKAADLVEWHKKPTTILQTNQAQPHWSSWYTDGELNLCYNCLDVHVQKGRGSQNALIYDSPVTNTKEKLTYQQLLDQVSTFAGALQDLGVQAGHRVIIYMPMMPESAIAMLACSRIGAVHSVVFGGFAAKELASRIQDCRPKVIISASVGVEPSRIVPYKPLLDEALKLTTLDDNSQPMPRCVIVQRRNVQECELGPNDLDYHELMTKSKPVEATPVPSSHYHHILYTSGTTALPKGAVRETGGWTVALKHAMSTFYDTAPGEVYWAASDIGWIVGHLALYAPLLQGCTAIMYEGKPVGTPDAGAFWRVIEEYSVNTFFVAPTAFRAIKQADPRAALAEKYDLRSLRTLFLAGEHSDPDTLYYCEQALQKYGYVKEAVDHWWQTELGSPAIGNAIGLGRIKARYGACTGAAPGFDMRILNEDGKEVGANELGSMVLKNPLPPGTLRTLYKNDERFVESYMTKFPGYYDTSDAAFFDDDGYIHIVGRVDDVINTAGHRLSTGVMEELLLDHPDVADAAVFPVKDAVKGEVPVGLVVTNKNCTIDPDELKSDLIGMIRRELGPVAAFKRVAAVKALPKTRSGKILRGTMSKIANGEDYSVSPTVEDPKVFDALEPEIRRLMKEIE